MKKFRKKVIYLFIFLLIPLSANAVEVTNNQVCVDGKLYKITNAGKEVNIPYINEVGDIKGFNITYNPNYYVKNANGGLSYKSVPGFDRIKISSATLNTYNSATEKLAIDKDGYFYVKNPRGTDSEVLTTTQGCYSGPLTLYANASDEVTKKTLETLFFSYGTESDINAGNEVTNKYTIEEFGSFSLYHPKDAPNLFYHASSDQNEYKKNGYDGVNYQFFYYDFLGQDVIYTSRAGFSGSLKNGFVCPKEYQFTAELQGDCVTVSNDEGAISEIEKNTKDGKTIYKKTGENSKYLFYTCPSGLEDSGYYGAENSLQLLTPAYNKTTGKYTIRYAINEKYKDYVYLCETDSNGNSCTRHNFNQQIPDSSLYYVEFTKNPGDVFFVNLRILKSNDGCRANTSLGAILRGIAPETLPNPIYNSTTCVDFRNSPKYNDLKAFIPYCSREQISYSSREKYTEGYVKSEIEKWTSDEMNLTSEVNTSGGDFKCAFDLKSDETINKKENFSTTTGLLSIPGTGEYWTAKCTETISLSYDGPQITKAGMGFGYGANIKIERKCQPIQLKKPEYKDTCTYDIFQLGYKHNGFDRAAGPDVVFDNCISECDGGEYTQKCIDYCYNNSDDNKTNSSSEIFAKTTKLKTNSRASILKLENKIGKDIVKDGKAYPGVDGGPEYYGIINASTYQTLFPNRQYIDDDDDLPDDWLRDIFASDEVPVNIYISSSERLYTNSPGIYGKWKCNYKWDDEEDEWDTGAMKCVSEHNQTFENFASSCDDYQYVYEVYRNYPCGDSGNYVTEVNKSMQEYNNVIAAIQSFNSSTDVDKKELYQIVVDEEYSQQKDGNYLSKTTIYDNTGSNNKIDFNETVSNAVTKFIESTNIVENPNVGRSMLTANNIDPDKLQVSVNEYTISRDINIKIGSSYLSRTDNNDIVFNTTNTNTDENLDKSFNYYPSANKYYTSINTKLVNNYMKWPYYNNENVSNSIDAYTKNIHINLKNLGSWHQWGSDSIKLGVDCIYGVSSGPTIGCCDDDCSCVTQEIQYIFRPIDLSDVFPNGRNPRFNWSSDAKLTANQSLYGTEIDPVKLTQTIQSKSESIYDSSSEVDYVFTLNTQQILSIRDYNKHVSDFNGDGFKNYLDYDMDCAQIDGREYCYSKFLGSAINNENKYFGYGDGYSSDRRLLIARCNNSKSFGTECDD